MSNPYPNKPKPHHAFTVNPSFDPSKQKPAKKIKDATIDPKKRRAVEEQIRLKAGKRTQPRMVE